MALPDDVMGPLFATMLLLMFVTGIVAMQTYQYWTIFRSDPLALRATILLLWILLFACTIVYALGIYDYLVVNFGNLSAQDTNPFPWRFFPFISQHIFTPVKLILIYRLWKFSSKLWLGLILVAMECLSYALGLVISVSAVLHPYIADTHTINRWKYATWFDYEVILNWLITLCLSYEILKSRSRAAPKTKSLLNWLLIYTIPTGLLPSILALGAAVSFEKIGNDSVWMMFYAAMHPST